MGRDQRHASTVRARAGADGKSAAGTGDGTPSSTGTDGPTAVLEVRVVALGAGEGGRWLAMGRMQDGSAVTFVTDAAAAECIADAMATGQEPVVVIERRQLV